VTYPSYRPSRRPRIPDLDALDPPAPSGLDQSPDCGHPAGNHLDEDDQSAAAGAHAASTSTGSQLLPLHTPTQAAKLLSVNESWLRRRAAARTIACTFLGKHLRFSPADLHSIITAGAHHPTTRPARPAPSRHRGGRPTSGGVGGRPPARSDHDADSRGPRRRRAASGRSRPSGRYGDTREVASWRG
jgi:excisionase family DNA binding protein